MNAEIIAVGTELLLGDIVNSHAQFISKELAGLGINVHYQTTVGDNIDRLRQVLAQALGRSEIIITTGGLGPTEDDLTKETVCDCLGIPLVLDEGVLGEIKAYFARSGREMSQNNVKQAMVPEGGVIFHNPRGTAPGLAIPGDRQCVIMLPGPPRELEPMFTEQAVPLLARYGDGHIVSRTLRIIGIGEGTVEEMLGTMLDGANPTAALYAKDGEVHLRITAKAQSQEEATAMIGPVEQAAREQLGDHVYGVDGQTLEQVVVETLIGQQKKIATAESCTGGLMSQWITAVSGSSQVFDFGISSYANRVKEESLGVPHKLLEQFGAVSAPVAIHMAKGAMKEGNAQIGIGITGIAGPTGGTEDKPVGTVYVAVTSGDQVWVERLALGHGGADEREYIRKLAVMKAFDMVRLVLIGSERAAAMLAPIDTALDQAVGGTSNDKAPWYLRAAKFVIPWKGDDVREIVRKSIFIVAVIAFITSAVILGQYLLKNAQSDQIVENIADVYKKVPTAEEIESLPDGYLKKFATLYAVNDEIKGWISIPNTKVDYPVVQPFGEDRQEYYLNHAFNQDYNTNGTPYLDYRATITRTVNSTNLVMYGHNIRGGRMFAEIIKYKDLAFYKENPVIDFDTVYEESKYKVIGAFITNNKPEHDDGQMFAYHNFIDAQSDEHFNWYIEEVRRRSLINTTVDVVPTDQLITLSTCTYEFDDARFVLVARKVRTGEDATVDTAGAVANPAPLYPQIWYDKNGGSKPELPANINPLGPDDGSGNTSSMESIVSWYVDRYTGSRMAFDGSELNTDSTGSGRTINNSVEYHSIPSSTSLASIANPSNPSQNTTTSKPSSSSKPNSTSNKPSSSSKPSSHTSTSSTKPTSSTGSTTSSPSSQGPTSSANVSGGGSSNASKEESKVSSTPAA